MVKMEIFMLQEFQQTRRGGKNNASPGYSTRAGATNPKRIQRVSVAGVGQRRGLRCPPLEMGHTVHSPRRLRARSMSLGLPAALRTRALGPLAPPSKAQGTGQELGCRLPPGQVHSRPRGSGNLAEYWGCALAGGGVGGTPSHTLPTPPVSRPAASAGLSRPSDSAANPSRAPARFVGRVVARSWEVAPGASALCPAAGKARGGIGIKLFGNLPEGA